MDSLHFFQRWSFYIKLQWSKADLRFVGTVPCRDCQSQQLVHHRWGGRTLWGLLLKRGHDNRVPLAVTFSSFPNGLCIFRAGWACLTSGFVPLSRLSIVPHLPVAMVSETLGRWKSNPWATGLPKFIWLVLGSISGACKFLSLILNYC